MSNGFSPSAACFSIRRMKVSMHSVRIGLIWRSALAEKVGVVIDRWRFQRKPREKNTCDFSLWSGSGSTGKG